MGEINPTLLAIIAVIVGPLVTYLIAARKVSGRIKDSDATELWAESKAIREWSAKRIKELDDHIDKIQQHLDRVEKANGSLTKENHKLTQEIDALRGTIQELQKQQDRFEDDTGGQHE